MFHPHGNACAQVYELTKSYKSYEFFSQALFQPIHSWKYLILAGLDLDVCLGWPSCGVLSMVALCCFEI